MNSYSVINITILEWNNIILQTLVPNVITLAIFIVLAVFGNVLVLLVYIFRMKENMEERYYIPILSAFDLIAAASCGGIMIYECFHQVTFQNDTVCRIISFFVGFLTFIPVYLLVIISVQRYLRVCRPTTSPLNVGVKRGLVVLCIVASFISACPLGFTFGTVPFKSSHFNLTGSQCSEVKKGTSLVATIYSLVLCFLVFVIFTVLICMYSKIGMVVYKNYKNSIKSSKYLQRGGLTNGSKNSMDSMDELSPRLYARGYSKYSDTKYENMDTVQFNQIQFPVSMTSVKQKSKLSKTNRRLTYKLALIFLGITIVFFVSFIPKVSILTIESVNSKFWEELSDVKRPGVMFLYQMFILNNVVNPFFYFFMDTKFRKEAEIFLKNVFRFKILN